MTTLLQLTTSLHAANGESSRLAARYVERFRTAHPGTHVIRRDLVQQPVPHLTAESFRAFGTPTNERDAEQTAAVAYSDSLIDELKAADTIAIGLPMYNFGVPSQLKAYFDHVARAGVTFRYTANGAEGLLKGKKVVVFATRGGRYAGSSLDTETAYVRQFLAFVGLTDVEFVYAEGLALGETQRAASLRAANETIDERTPAVEAAARPQRELV